jgi:hypothetical protein
LAEEGFAMASPTPSPNDLTRQQLDELDALLQRMLSLPIGSGMSGASPAASSATPAAASQFPSVLAAHPGLADYPLPPEWKEPAAATPPVPPPGWRSDAPATSARPPHWPSQPFRGEDDDELASNSVAVVSNSAGVAGGAASQPVSRDAVINFAGSESAGTGFESQPSPASSDSLSVTTTEMNLKVPRTVRGVDAPLVPPPPVATASAVSSTTPSVSKVAATTPPPEEAIPLRLNAETCGDDPGQPTALSPQVCETASTCDRAPAPVGTPIWLWPLIGMNAVIELLLGLMGPIGRFMMHPTVRQLLGWVGLMLLTAAAVWSAVSLGWVPGVR